MTKPKQKKTPQNIPDEKDAPVRPLRDREELFCREVVQGKNNGDAYISAGYKAKNKLVASALANRLLKNDKIRDRIDELRLESAEKYRLTPNRIMFQTGAILNADMRDYMKWSSNGMVLKSSDELTDEQAAAISEVTETVTKDGGRVTFKLHSKSHSQELGAKILKMVTDKPVDAVGVFKLTEINDEELLNLARGRGARAPKKAQGSRKSA